MFSLGAKGEKKELTFDVARCFGETEEGICMVRNECLRFTERDTAQRLALFLKPSVETVFKLKIDMLLRVANQTANG